MSKAALLSSGKLPLHPLSPRQASAMDPKEAQWIQQCIELGHESIQRVLAMNASMKPSELVLRRGGTEASLYHKLIRYGVRSSATERPNGIGQGVANECFRNALKLLMRSRKAGAIAHYAEGLATSETVGYLPIHHGWLVDENGKVIDNTWSDPQRSSYFGIVFRDDFIFSRHRRLRRGWEPVLEFLATDQPLKLDDAAWEKMVLGPKASAQLHENAPSL